MNTLELSNVEIGEKLQKEMAEYKNAGRECEFVMLKMLDPVIQRLATLYPLWRFVAVNSGYGGSGKLATTEFAVIEAGELIGKIARHHHGHKEVIYVSNDRIARARERSNGYRTVDADKAVLMAKKMFFRLKPNERIEQAVKDAQSVVDHQKRLKDRELYNHESTVRQAANEYVMGTGFPLFLEHIKALAEHERNKIKNSIQEKERLDLEMVTIAKAKSEFEAGKTALVIKDDGKYLVKVGDKIDLYDDNTLPDWMRSKLGMLKLVQEEQFVADTGYRVNSETFVLLMEET